MRKDHIENKLPQLQLHPILQLSRDFTLPSTDLYLWSGVKVAYGALLCRWEMKKAEGKAEAKSTRSPETRQTVSPLRFEDPSQGREELCQLEEAVLFSELKHLEI